MRLHRLFPQPTSAFEGVVVVTAARVLGQRVDVPRAPAPEFRDMVLRRMRTVMDQYFAAPNLLENRYAELANLMDPPSIGVSDADRDFSKWGSWQNSGGGTGGTSMRFFINQITSVYLPGRRNFINSTSLAGATLPPSQPATSTTTRVASLSSGPRSLML